MQQPKGDMHDIQSWGSEPNLSSGEPMTQRIAFFVSAARFDLLSEEACLALKRNILDSLGCAISALAGEPAEMLREQFRENGGAEVCTLIGGGKTSPAQAALFNSVLVRYVDVLDTYMAPGGLCHPSDNFGAILAAAEMADRSGKEFMLALAVAYEVQCRFTEAVPVMFRGLNHALQLSISVSAGSSKLLGLTAEQTANAIATAASDNVSLAVVHVEPVSHWKAISPGISAMRALYVTSMAKRGFTGPIGLFEGPNGLNRLFDQVITIDWEDVAFESVRKTVLKKYCALVHGQPVIETVLAMRKQFSIRSEEVVEVKAEVFQFAYEIAGGGRFGSKGQPRTKEQADYNLKYLISAALIDGEVGPAQLEIERVLRADVQDMLTKVQVVPAREFTLQYPAKMAVRVIVKLRDGKTIERQQDDFEGSVTRPLSWERVVEKFHWLSEPFAPKALRDSIVGAVDRLEKIQIGELTSLLGQVSPKVSRERRLPPL